MPIPVKYSKSSFALMAPYLGRAYRAWPEPILVSSQSLSNETLAEYLRRAIKAKRDYGHSHRLISDSDFLHKELLLQITEKGVRIGSPDKIREKPTDLELAIKEEGVNLSSEIDLGEPSDYLISCACELMASRLMNPPPIFTLICVRESFINNMSETFADKLVIEQQPEPDHYKIL